MNIKQVTDKIEELKRRRESTEEMLKRIDAKIEVLEELIEKPENGEAASDVSLLRSAAS